MEMRRRGDLGCGRARTDRGGVESRTTAWALEAGLNEASMSPSSRTSASRLDCLACSALLCANACLAITDAIWCVVLALARVAAEAGSEDASDDEGEGLGSRRAASSPASSLIWGPGAGESKRTTDGSQELWTTHQSVPRANTWQRKIEK